MPNRREKAKARARPKARAQEAPPESTVPPGKNPVFISYASADRERVLPIVAELRAIGASSWLDVREIRPGDRLSDVLFGSIENCSVAVVVLSKQVAGHSWVEREIRHALDHGVRIIPCLMEECERPADLSDHAYADFTQGFSAGMRALLRGLYRRREVVTCHLDPANPLQFESTYLRVELRDALLTREEVPSLLFHLDTTSLLSELEKLAPPLPDHLEHAAEVATGREQAKLLMPNLGAALGPAALEVPRIWKRRPGIEYMLLETIQTAAWLTLYEFWCLVRGYIVRDLTQLRSVDGTALQRILAEIEARPHGTQTQPRFAEMARFACTAQEMQCIELAGQAPIASARLWLPRSAVPKDTLEMMQRHVHPLPPDTEILGITWLRYFVPGLVRRHAWMCTGEGLWLADNLHRYSVSQEGYSHMGLP